MSTTVSRSAQAWMTCCPKATFGCSPSVCATRRTSAQHLTRLRAGLYEVRHFTGVIRVVVIYQLPLQEQNATLHLFSAKRDWAPYGAEHHRPHSIETSTLLYQRFQRNGVVRRYRCD